MRGGRGQGPDMGALMLAMQIARIGVENIGAVTMAVLGINAVLFFYDIDLPFSTADTDICIDAAGVWYRAEYKRLFLHAWFHTSSMHLYYNMSSLLLKVVFPLWSCFAIPCFSFRELPKTGAFVGKCFETFAFCVADFLVCNHVWDCVDCAVAAFRPVFPAVWVCSHLRTRFFRCFVWSQHYFAVCSVAARTERRLGISRSHALSDTRRAGPHFCDGSKRQFSRPFVRNYCRVHV
jgi:hypothetical protein